MEHMLYWLWLTIKSGITPVKVTLLLEYFESIEDIYFSRSFNNIYGISDKDKIALLDKDLSEAERVAEKTMRLGAKIIVFDDKNYPQMLKNITNPPYVLYILGKIPELDEVLTIGVVGTRKSSLDGNRITEKICTELAENGVVTIAGLAAGIDAVGAWATINAGGIAVGVIGCGIDRVYPAENAELYKAMAVDGCIITEYPPGAKPLRHHFPERNRIIAGLSRGVLVIEAPGKSGSLITAEYALEYNRDVFAVPGNINDINCRGANALIQKGAKLVLTAEDIICEYPYAVKIPTVKKKKGTEIKPVSDIKVKDITGKIAAEDNEKYKNLTEKEKCIFELLQKGDMQIDEMSRELKMPVSELNTKLIMLEVKGVVKKLPGSRYQLKI